MSQQMAPRAGNQLRAAAPRLPGIDGQTSRPYGAQSEASVLVGDLLVRYVPSLAAGDLEIVAIARRPGVLSKVVLRRTAGTRLEKRPISLVLGIGADHANQVRNELGGEQIHLIQWHANPTRYIAEALSLGYLPPMVFPGTRRAEVLLGEIDFRGVRGWQSMNLLLASSVTGWRIRLKRIARSAAWQALETARQQHRHVPADVVALLPKGLSVEVYGLHALVPTGQVQGVRRSTPFPTVNEILHRRLGQQILVQVLRMDEDAGSICVSERVPSGRQLELPWSSSD
jgi:transcription antitermination factor NusA-like protein